MKISTLIKKLSELKDKEREVSIEVPDSDNDYCYESEFDLFVDDRGDVGLSPVRY